MPCCRWTETPHEGIAQWPNPPTRLRGSYGRLVAYPFEGYLVETLLGHGGEAGVYRARRIAGDNGGRFGSAVAIKILDEDHRDDAAVARLAREFRVAQRLTHPHIIEVYEHGAYWIAMQYIDGGPISRLESMADRLEALAQVADALDCTHRSGIVHTDVKPTNILVHQDFSAKSHSRGVVLVDFGAAHVLAEEVWNRSGRMLASLPYAAPELLQGRLPQAATDEYALACTALEVLTGLTPYAADNPSDLIDAHLHRPPPDVSALVPWLTRSFDVVFARSIAKDPDRRYASCAEMIQHISAAIRR